MSFEFSDELKLGNRLIILAGAPFAALIGTVLTSQFGVFGPEAYDLVTSVFLGDFARFGDFLGFILVFFCSVVVSIILVVVCLYAALLSPNHITNIDADRRMVNCDYQLPLTKRYIRSYSFDEVSIGLIYDDESNRITLRVPDRWLALTLISESCTKVAERKFKQLLEIGLPSR